MKKENVKDDIFTPEEIEEVVKIIDKALEDFKQIPSTDDGVSSSMIQKAEAGAKQWVQMNLPGLKFKAKTFCCGCKAYIEDLAKAIEDGKNSNIFSVWMDIVSINKKYYPIPSKSKKKSTHKKK